MFSHKLILSLLLLLLSAASPTVSLSLPAASSTHCHPADRKTLLSIMSSLGSTSVDPSDCCTWWFVGCSPSGRVNSISLYRDNTLHGPIPSAVGDLPYLTDLTLRKIPNLTGSIPYAITKLTKLTFLRLDWNSLSGPVPAFLSQLTSLDYLNLGFNKFSGTIPSAIGGLPLSYIQLDRNRLSGPIPDSLGGSPAQRLFLSHNNLSGPIPKSFSNAAFQVIELSRNRLIGDATILFGESKPLQRLDLSRNGFVFDLSKVKLPKGMVELVLDHNKVYGAMPSEFAMREWQNLNVSYNRLCGAIPGGDNMTRFDEYVFFHNKCLCGPPLSPCTRIRGFDLMHSMET